MTRNSIVPRSTRQRWPLLIVAAVAIAALSACASNTARNPPLTTQSDVELERYAGVWYEQARLPNRFQKSCVGEVQATYTVLPDSRIRVINQCRSEDGGTKLAEGLGRLAQDGSDADPARLKVRFAPSWLSWLPAVWGDYWIVRLEGDYQYSLVGTPDRKYLWILSRDKAADATRVDALLDHAKTLGFPVEQVVSTSQN